MDLALTYGLGCKKVIIYTVAFDHKQLLKIFTN